MAKGCQLELSRCQSTSTGSTCLYEPRFICAGASLLVDVEQCTVQDGGEVRYEPAAQSCMQHLGASERAEPRDVGSSLMISALTFIDKMFSVNKESINFKLVVPCIIIQCE